MRSVSISRVAPDGSCDRSCDGSCDPLEVEECGLLLSWVTVGLLTGQGGLLTWERVVLGLIGGGNVSNPKCGHYWDLEKSVLIREVS